MEARAENRVFQGQPCVALSLPNGDSALVSLLGAQVVSWVAAGRERLYLSPRSVWDGQAAIRGGVPVCFPQFNQRGSLPKHGFARNLPWLPEAPVLAAQAAHLTLVLRDSAATRRWWPQAFEARLAVVLTPGSLSVTLHVRNTDTQPLSFTGALHTYLAVDEVAHTQLHGLQGQPEWNAVTGVRGVAEGVLAFAGEFDRVYTAPVRPMRLIASGVAAGSMRASAEVGQAQADVSAGQPESPQGVDVGVDLDVDSAVTQLTITQGGGFDQCVVWNPGPTLCAQLADMPADGHRHMLCVEAACVDTPAVLPPGGTWQGGQRLVVG